MITEDGWLDWAVRVPGPEDKANGVRNPARGYIPHSAVGFYGGWTQRLFSTERRADGRYTAYAAASVHGWIAYDGTVTQHYPLTAACWASGSSFPNNNFVAFENEGGFAPHDEALTPAQLQANVRIIREIAIWAGWPNFRRPTNPHDPGANLYEHKECVRWGSAPTACPSNRIPWERILAELTASASATPETSIPRPDGRTVTVRMETGVDVVMDVDEYAKGVLPYEMSTGWPMEALKAQAVAAKSYAIAGGIVYSDARSQVYGPLRHADTNEAVEQVRGVYLADRGQIVMPFYFGHCNGQTRTPSEAGWNPVADRSYLAGVSCPCGHTSYFGHGIGMCQRGAQAMANRGATFDAILRHYYQGIDLIRFEKAEPHIPPANATIYRTQPGDTLEAVARRFGVDSVALLIANLRLLNDPNLLPMDYHMLIPRTAEEAGQPDVYVVQPGDTLFSLARSWGSPVTAIVEANGIEDERMIRIGQRLLRP